VIVTGAAGELGYRLSERLYRAGYGVFMLDRVPIAHPYLRERLDGGDPWLRESRVDLTHPGALDQLSEAAPRPLHALVNMAGLKVFGAFTELAAVDFEKVIETNLIVPTRLCRWAIGHLEHGGVIVNVVSAAGFSAPAGYTAYSASKFGLLGFSMALAEELRGCGIRLNTLCPPTVATSEFLQREGTSGSAQLVPAERFVSVAMRLMEPGAMVWGRNVRFFTLRKFAGSVWRDVRRWVMDACDMVRFR